MKQRFVDLHFRRPEAKPVWQAHQGIVMSLVMQRLLECAPFGDVLDVSAYFGADAMEGGYLDELAGERLPALVGGAA